MGDTSRNTTTLIPLSLILLLSAISTSVCSEYEYQYNTLFLSPLPNQSSSLHSHPQSQSVEEQESQPDEYDADDDDSFTVPLHHIDSISSSSSSPHTTISDRLHRDALRVQSLSSLVQNAAATTTRHTRNNNRKGRKAGNRSFSSPVISGLSQGSGEYFTLVGVGTPPKPTYMVLDTGSDVVWLQCKPCLKCYSQTNPIFDPSLSRSFRPLPCSSPLCRALDQPGCTRRRTCAYQVSYGDGSFTLGQFVQETLTFTRRHRRRGRGARAAKSGFTVPGVALGCGHDNEGLFVGAAGLLGLGRGKLSFPSQTGRRFSRTFSYCLLDRSSPTTTNSPPSPSSSTLIFGKSAAPRRATATSTISYTPLLKNPTLDAAADSFYYVSLTGISVGGARVRGITAELFGFDAAGNGGVIIDSGTSVTRLAGPAYVALRDAFRKGMAASGMRVAGEGFSLFDTCYDLSGRKEVRVPTVALHFEGGAEVGLPAGNYMFPVDKEGKKFCFAFAGTTGGGLSIVGNIQQQGFRVVFDEGARRVGFVPGACR